MCLRYCECFDSEMLCAELIETVFVLMRVYNFLVLSYLMYCFFGIFFYCIKVNWSRLTGDELDCCTVIRPHFEFINFEILVYVIVSLIFDMIFLMQMETLIHANVVSGIVWILKFISCQFHVNHWLQLL